MVGVFGHEHAEERAAVDEDVVYRRVSWLSAEISARCLYLSPETSV